jgi:hypothetical protein
MITKNRLCIQAGGCYHFCQQSIFRLSRLTESIHSRSIRLHCRVAPLLTDVISISRSPAFQTAAADQSFFPSTDLRLGLQQDLGQTKDSHHGHISRIRSSSSRYPQEGRPRQHVSLRAHSLEVPTNLPAPRQTAVTPRCCACPQNCETGSMPTPSTRRSYAFSRPQCPTKSSAPSLLSPHAAKSITRGSRSTALSLLSISPSIAMLASRTAFDS